MVTIAKDGNGVVTFPVWNVPNLIRPTADQIKAAMAAPEPPPDASELIAAANFKANALIGTSRTYALSGGNAIADATSGTIADIGNMATSTATQPWVDNNNNVSTVTGAQMSALLPLVVAYRASVFVALASVITAIKGGDPTLTTVDQVNGYAWPI